jgi:hypothetical protein
MRSSLIHWTRLVFLFVTVSGMTLPNFKPLLTGGGLGTKRKDYLFKQYTHGEISMSSYLHKYDPLREAPSMPYSTKPKDAGDEFSTYKLTQRDDLSNYEEGDSKSLIEKLLAMPIWFYKTLFSRAKIPLAFGMTFWACDTLTWNMNLEGYFLPAFLITFGWTMFSYGKEPCEKLVEEMRLATLNELWDKYESKRAQWVRNKEIYDLIVKNYASDIQNLNNAAVLKVSYDEAHRKGLLRHNTAAELAELAKRLAGQEMSFCNSIKEKAKDFAEKETLAAFSSSEQLQKELLENAVAALSGAKAKDLVGEMMKTKYETFNKEQVPTLIKEFRAKVVEDLFTYTEKAVNDEYAAYVKAESVRQNAVKAALASAKPATA